MSAQPGVALLCLLMLEAAWPTEGTPTVSVATYPHTQHATPARYGDMTGSPRQHRGHLVTTSSPPGTGHARGNRQPLALGTTSYPQQGTTTQSQQRRSPSVALLLNAITGDQPGAPYSVQTRAIDSTTAPSRGGMKKSMMSMSGGGKMATHMPRKNCTMSMSAGAMVTRMPRNNSTMSMSRGAMKTGMHHSKMSSGMKKKGMSTRMMKKGMSTGMMKKGMSTGMMKKGMSTGMMKKGMSTGMMKKGMSTGMTKKGMSTLMMKTGMSTAMPQKHKGHSGSMKSHYMTTTTPVYNNGN